MADKNMSGLPDLTYVVWVDHSMPTEFHAHGLSPVSREQVVFCRDEAHANAAGRGLMTMFPGRTVFMAAAIKKIPCKVTVLPSLTINLQGEVFPA